MLALLAAEGMVLVYLQLNLSRPNPVGPELSQDATPPTEQPEPRALHTNKPGGFQFFVPRNWSLEETSKMSQLSSPQEEEVVTLARVPERKLSLAENRLIDSMRSSYQDVVVTGRATSADGLTISRRLRGRATSGEGVPVRFAAGLTQQHEHIFVLLAFHAGSDPGPILGPGARAISRSFKPIT